MSRKRHRSSFFVCRRGAVLEHLDWLMSLPKGAVTIEATSGDPFWTLRFESAVVAGDTHRRLLGELAP